MNKKNNLNKSHKKWDLRYLKIAKEVSNWSKDPAKKVGCVIVGRHGQIISQGYNGFPREYIDSDVDLNNREVKHNLTIHAEMNALCNALLTGTSTHGCTMYVTGLPPCKDCSKFIAQAGIVRIVHQKVEEIKKTSSWYENCKIGESTLLQCNVEIVQYSKKIIDKL